MTNQEYVVANVISNGKNLSKKDLVKILKMVKLIDTGTLAGRDI